MHQDYTITHLKQLESEAIFILRETAAQFEKPVLLFSGGKDSIVMAHLAKKAFWPAKLPFQLLHVDTGHNFPETMEFRDQYVADLGAELIVGSVQKAIDEGKVVEEKGARASLPFRCSGPCHCSRAISSQGSHNPSMARLARNRRSAGSKGSEPVCGASRPVRILLDAQRSRLESIRMVRGVPGTRAMLLRFCLCPA